MSLWGSAWILRDSWRFAWILGMHEYSHEFDLQEFSRICMDLQGLVGISENS